VAVVAVVPVVAVPVAVAAVTDSFGVALAVGGATWWHWF
jgi:hypothetical protein